MEFEQEPWLVDGFKRNEKLQLERLVPASEALDLLAREHDRRGTQSDWQACHNAAHETLMARLMSGHLIAYAETCEIDCTEPRPDYGTGAIIREEDYFKKTEFCKVPAWFWCHYDNAGKTGQTSPRSFDSVSGDFRFHFMDEDNGYCWRTGGAYSVAFDRTGLPNAAIPDWSLPPLPENALEPAKPDSVSHSKGRPREDWWPDFVAELVAYVKEVGIPNGVGHQGQSLILKEVSDRLAERGKQEPGRTQSQETINAVLRRMRQPENPR